MNNIRIVKMVCPQCNARLEIDADNTRAICEYCGYHFLMLKESDKTNINKDNLEEYAADLAEKVKQLIDPAGELEREKTKISLLDAEIKNSRMRINKYAWLESFFNSAIGRWIPAIVPCLILFYSIYQAISNRSFGAFLSGTVWAVIVGLIILAVRFFLNYECKHVRAGIDRKTEEIEKHNNRIQEILKSNDFSILAEPYRNKETIEYIYSSLVRHRAYTIQQAIGLYEEEKHRADLQEQYDRKLRDLEARQMGLHEKQLEVFEKMNQPSADKDNSLSALDTVIAAGTVIAVGSKIAKAIKDLK